MIVRYSTLKKLASLRLKDIADVKVGMEDADFYIIRRGDKKQVGKPVKDYNPEHIGIKVTRTDLIVPDLLFYSLLNLYMQGTWEQKATGSLKLVNIQTSDIKNIALR